LTLKLKSLFSLSYLGVKLRTDIKRAFEFFGEALGKILVVIGVVLFFVGILFFGSSAHQMISATGLLLGTLCLITGIVLHLEGLPELKFPSKSGLGTVLICVSIMFLVGSMIFVFVIKIPLDYKIPGRFSFEVPVAEFLESRGVPHEVILGIREIAMRPLAWLAPLSVVFGLCALLIGFLLKFRYGN